VPLITTSNLDDLDDIRKQAKTILEENCFECHGENGPHKDVLLMDNQLELWDLGIIHPGNPDASILFRRILGHPAYGPQMPLGKPPLSEEEIDIIEIWLSYFRGKIQFPSGNIHTF
jgi:mono/diheme cytochrome c family protein